MSCSRRTATPTTSTRRRCERSARRSSRPLRHRRARPRARSGDGPIGVSEGEKRSSVAGFRIEPVPAVHPGEHCVGYVDHRPGRDRLSTTPATRPGSTRACAASTSRSSRSTASWQHRRRRGGPARAPRSGRARRAVPLRHVRVQHGLARRVRRGVRAPGPAVPRAAERRAPHPGAALGHHCGPARPAEVAAAASRSRSRFQTTPARRPRTSVGNTVSTR